MMIGPSRPGTPVNDTPPAHRSGSLHIECKQAVEFNDLTSAMFASPTGGCRRLAERSRRVAGGRTLRVQTTGWPAAATAALHRMLRELAAQLPAQALGLTLRSALVSAALNEDEGLWSSTVAMGVLLALHGAFCIHAADLVLRSGAIADRPKARALLSTLPYALTAASSLLVAHRLGAARGRVIATAAAGGVVSSFTSSQINQLLKGVGGSLEFRTADGEAAPRELLATAVDPWRRKGNQLAYAVLAVIFFLAVAQTLKPAHAPDPAEAGFMTLMGAGWSTALAAVLLEAVFGGTETLIEAQCVQRASSADGTSAGLQVVFKEGTGFERPTLRSLRTAAGGRTALRQLFRVLPDAAEAGAAFFDSKSKTALALKIAGRLLSFPMGQRNWIQQQADAAEGTGRPVTDRRASVAMPVAPTTMDRRPSTVLDGERLSNSSS
jgi:hypothetical protein